MCVWSKRNVMAGGWQGPSVTSGGVSNLWLSIPLTASLHRCRSRNERRKCSNGKKRGWGVLESSRELLQIAQRVFAEAGGSGRLCLSWHSCAKISRIWTDFNLSLWKHERFYSAFESMQIWHCHWHIYCFHVDHLQRLGHRILHKSCSQED